MKNANHPPFNMVTRLQKKELLLKSTPSESSMHCTYKDCKTLGHPTSNKIQDSIMHAPRASHVQHAAALSQFFTAHATQCARIGLPYLSGTVLNAPTRWVFSGRRHSCLICAHCVSHKGGGGYMGNIQKALESSYLEHPGSACCTNDMFEIFVRLGRCLCCLLPLFVNTQLPCPHGNSLQGLLLPQMHHKSLWCVKGLALRCRVGAGD